MYEAVKKLTVLQLVKQFSICIVTDGPDDLFAELCSDPDDPTPYA